MIKLFILQRTKDDRYLCDATSENGWKGDTDSIKNATPFTKKKMKSRIAYTDDLYIVHTVVADKVFTDVSKEFPNT